MHFLLGWFFAQKVSDSLGEVNRANNNAIWGLLLWILFPSLASWGAHSNFGPDAAPIGGVVAFLALMAFVLWKPVLSPFKVMMLAAVQLVLGLILLWNGGILLIRTGYFVLSGEMKRVGFFNGPWNEMISAAIYAGGAIVVLMIIALVTQRDEERLARLARGNCMPANSLEN